MSANQKIEGGQGVLKHGAMHIVQNRGASSAYDLNMHNINAVLSSGKNSSVVQAKHLASKQVYACKTIRISSLQSQKWVEDLEKIKTLDNLHICKLYEAWEERKRLYLIFEFCRGGDLTSLLRAKPANEGTISVLVRQMVGAVTHLHQHDIVHGDIKCQDFLFAEPVMADTKAFQMQLKMIDFGFVARYCKSVQEDLLGEGEHATKHRKHMLQDQRLPICLAPEQLDNSGPAPSGADVWALGVLCFFLIAGKPPFSRTGCKWKENIRAGAWDFEHERTWQGVTKEAKDFIRSCLTRSPRDRPAAAEMLEAPWMILAKEVFDESLQLHESKLGQGKFKGTISILDAPLPSAQTILMSFKRMHQLGALEKAAMTAAAYHLSGEKMTTLRNTFESLDRNGDGVLSAKELQDGLQASGVSAPELMEILQDVDLDGDGVIEYTEFITATYEFQRSMQDHMVETVFRKFDQDGSGKVSKAEILQALGHKEKQKDLRASFPNLDLDVAVEELDKNGDGQISHDEFLQLLHRSSCRAHHRAH